MKRIVLAAMLLVSTAAVFATESKGSEVSGKETAININAVKQDECQVTISGKVGPSFMQVEVKCSYTASTCKEAITKAVGCLEDAKKAVMQ